MSEAFEIPAGTMTREAFHRWAEQQPRGRFELEAGRVVAMAPERAAHADAKALAWLALRLAIERADLACKAYVVGLAVAVDDETSYEPDALVHCGDALHPDAVAVEGPVIVVEVTSPSNSRVDLDTKFLGCFRVPSIQHYLIVHLGKRVVIHHRRRDVDRVESAILGSGTIELDPAGLAVTVEALLP